MEYVVRHTLVFEQRVEAQSEQEALAKAKERTDLAALIKDAGWTVTPQPLGHTRIRKLQEARRC